VARFRQADGASLHIERLRDGSMAVYDERSKSVHSLNASAAALWDACAEGASLDELRAALERRVGTAFTGEMAEEAVASLVEVGLVECDTELPREIGRRGLLAAGLMVPAVLTLTLAEQRAYAQEAGSRGEGGGGGGGEGGGGGGGGEPPPTTTAAPPFTTTHAGTGPPFTTTGTTTAPPASTTRVPTTRPPFTTTATTPRMATTRMPTTAPPATTTLRMTTTSAPAFTTTIRMTTTAPAAFTTTIGL
jgi:PqqD family protein of HPr-rel-A system